MSLYRFVYYSAVIGGWAAFLAWMLAERWAAAVALNLTAIAVARFGAEGSIRGTLEVVIVGCLVGAAIGAGLNLVSGMSHAQWKRQLKRLPSGLIGGGLGGAIGAYLGNVIYSAVGLPRALGWMIMGLAIGSVEGLSEGSAKKLRNGLFGGGLGGLLGGWLFDRLAVADADMAARATAFVILGISIGAMIGLTHLVLKEAWLTVLDGFRPGRELILSQTVTVLGRGDYLPLPLLGRAGRDLESEHAKIARQPDGGFVIEDNRSRLGTLLNGRAIQGPTPLHDGDLIRLGGNIVRFRLRHGSSQRAVVPSSGQEVGRSGPILPPPLPLSSRPVSPGAAERQTGPPRPPDSPGPSAPGPRIPPPPPPPGSNR